MELELIKDRQIETCITLFRSAFNNEVWNENWTFEQAKRRLENILYTPDSLCYKIWDKEKEIGFIFGIVEPLCEQQEYTIREYCISPYEQGNGYGSKALQLLEKTLALKDIHKICLATMKHPQTIHFYEKNGYEPSQYVWLSKKI